MEEMLSKAYRGDSGVPHSDPERLVATWSGCFAFAAVAWVNSQTSNLANRVRINWHDKAMMLDHHQWKKILEKKQNRGKSGASK